MPIAMEKPKNQCAVLLPKSMTGKCVKVSIQSLRLQLKKFKDDQAVELKFDEFAGMKRITFRLLKEKGIEGTTDIRNVCLRSNVTVATSIRELLQVERWLNKYPKEVIFPYFEDDMLTFHVRTSCVRQNFEKSL